MIKIKVSKQNIRVSAPTIVEGSIGYLEVDLSFNSAEWRNMNKFCHFRSGETVKTFHVSDGKIDNAEGFNLEAGEWTVYLHGEKVEDGKLVQRITTETAKLTVKPNGFAEGELTDEPTPVPSILGEMELGETTL